MTCRFCFDPAIGEFAFNFGCIARPEDRYQALCLHHAMRSQPLGTMTLMVDCTSEGVLTSGQLKGPWTT